MDKQKAKDRLVSAGMFTPEDRYRLSVITSHRSQVNAYRHVTKGQVLGDLINREYRKVQEERGQK